MTGPEYTTALTTLSLTPGHEECYECENGGRVPVGFAYTCPACGNQWYDDAMEDDYDWR